MKIAVFHNFLDNIGGAEIVTLTLAREFQANVYTTNIDVDKVRQMGFSDVLPRIHTIGKVSINPPWRQQKALYLFSQLNLSNKYDYFIISGDWAMSAAMNNHPNLWYVHSPIREIWDLYSHTRQNLVPFWGRGIFDLWVKFNRYLSRKYIKNVDRLVCNSKNTQNRLKKYLNKDATIIYPPIQVPKFYCRRSDEYWLSVNRLIKHKRIDMQFRAFEKLPDSKLVMVGSYEKADHFKAHAKECHKAKPSNIEIKSWVSEEELVELYANSRGFIATAQDEDFGMTVVEAMASGKPVIAGCEGGYRETVVHGKTGRLIEDIDANKLYKAVKELDQDIRVEPDKYKNACIKRAYDFDTSVFIKKIKQEIDSSLE